MSSKRQLEKREEMKTKFQLTRFKNIFSENPEKCFTPEELKQTMDTDAEIEMGTVLKYIRHLTTNGIIRNVQTEEGRNRYKYVPENLQNKFSGLTEECHFLYTLIEASGDQGIWRGDFKKKTNIDEKQLTQLLNQLKKRELVKEVTSVLKKQKRLFLFDTAPSKEVTGGIWFNGTQFNYDLVERTLPSVAKIVADSPNGCLTFRELKHRIKTSLTNQSYTSKEAKQLITATICSGKLIETNNGLLKPGPTKTVTDPISKTPCKGCPRFWVCEPNGPINPVDCIYLQEMTEF